MYRWRWRHDQSSVLRNGGFNHNGDALGCLELEDASATVCAAIPRLPHVCSVFSRHVLSFSLPWISRTLLCPSFFLSLSFFIPSSLLLSAFLCSLSLSFCKSRLSLCFFSHTLARLSVRISLSLSLFVLYLTLPLSLSRSRALSYSFALPPSLLCLSRSRFLSYF